MKNLSDLWKKEDWLAVWIGFVVILIACIAVLTGAFDFSAAKFSTWHLWENVAEKKSLLAQLNGAFWGKLLKTFVVLALLFTCGVKLQGRKVKEFLPAFTCLFVLAVIVRLISAEFTLNRYLEWAFWALIVGLLIAVPAGIYSAVHRYQRRDYAVVTASFLGSSIPGFFLSLLLIYVFTVRLKWLPSFGMSTAGTGGDAWDVLQHLAMPALVLALSIAGNNIRYIRSAMLEILSMDYLRTARSKGIGRRLVINKHALRNALLPIITVIGMEIPVLFGGSIIIEQIFSWPGLGLITMNAITGRDYPVIMGVSLLSAVVVLAANLITDILYALADPTIKY